MPDEMSAGSGSAPMRLARVLAGVLGMLAGSAALADGATIAQKGASSSIPACQSCHGANGEGVPQAGFPRLAGLGAAYLQRQLAAFADGSRVSPEMMPIAKALSPADRSAVASYYAALSFAAPAAPPASAAPVASSRARPTAAAAIAAASTPPVGATLATRGRWSDTLPACDQCHAPGGRGVGADFPPLVGQSPSYLAAQLTAFRSGARPPGPLALMAVISKKLSDADIAAVADHYGSLSASAER